MNATTLHRIDLEVIRPNPDQNRKDFDPRSLAELAKSILAAGKLHQPITVRPIPAEGRVCYEVVAGERRYRAHRILADKGHAEFAQIVCHVEEMDDEQRDVVMIVENVQRCDVNPVEEADGYQRLIGRGRTIEQIVEMTGKDAFRIRERLALVKLDSQIQHLVKTGQLAPTCGAELAKLDLAKQCEVLRKITGGKISTISEIRAAVTGIQERDAQGDMLGGAPVATKAEMAKLGEMERKIEDIKAMVSSGWKDGECVVAKKVNPDQVRKMAESLDLIRLCCDRMARELRGAVVQRELIES